MLMGEVFKEGVDDIYAPMAEFADIPPPLYAATGWLADRPRESAAEEVLSAKDKYYDDRVLQESVE